MANALLKYKQLIAETPPKVIRSPEEASTALKKLTELTRRWNSLSGAERDLHETLKVLLEEFERRTFAIAAATPIEVIQELMDANGLKQKDLVGIFPTESVVSEVLKGNRRLTVDYIKRLSERFNVSPAVFF